MKNLLSAICLLAAMATAAQKAKVKTTDVKLSSAALGKFEARCIGTAATSGRITAIDGYNNDPRILYVGTAGGGVWKSTNGGASFKPVFDKHCQSIGALAIDQTNADVVWVGTGESNMRNTVSIGNGMYKTTDGGENWVYLGLPESEHISKVVIHPRDPNTVFVAVPGKLYSNSSERGLYKTTDGGKSWQKILFVNDSTGCADFVLNPQNPDVMYASFWQFRRTPYSFSSGGPGSAVMKSTDGGKTWRKIHNGFPAGDIGRAALAIAPSAPDNIVCIVESKRTSLFLSTNGGEEWKEQSADDNVCARPFYFSTLVVDPVDAKRVYRPAFEFSFSDDGGYSWVRAQQASGWVHVDMHALWINPNNTQQMYVGTDGGVYMSVDRGNNWLFLPNLPVSQFYHVQVDDATPYNVLGGLQDNGSWRAPSQKNGGVRNGDWNMIGWGDGFWVQPDGEDRDIIYSEYQGGHAQRWDVRANQAQDIQPKEGENDPKFRFNWNTPIYRSPNNKKRIYMAAQFLFRSDDRGLTWEKISPDLTTNDPRKQQQEQSGGLTADNTSAENHCTIFTVAESPLDADLLFVGTDDGNLQLSTDGGKNWRNVSKQIAACGVPPQTWVSSIEPSRFDRNTLYATFDNHMYGDMKTYIAKSTDLGQTWTLFRSEVFKGYAHKVKEDLVSKDLLFAGTEMGLYVTIDGGNNWVQMKAGIPEYCLVRDIVIEPRTNDLVLGTHGRGVLIVDDIAPLRAINQTLLNSDLAILPCKPTPVCNPHYGGAYGSAGEFVGRNSNEEAQILYYMKNRLNSGSVKVEILDADGRVLVDLPGTKRKGINRISWNMRTRPPRVAEGGSKADWSSTVGPFAREGKYKVRVTAGTLTAEGSIELIADPNTRISKADRDANYEAVARTFRMQEQLAVLMDSLLNEQKLIVNDTAAAAIVREYYDSLEAIRATLVPVKTGRTVGFADEERLRDKLSDVYFGLSFYEGLPTLSQNQALNRTQRDILENTRKLDERKRTYRPKVKEAMKGKWKNEPY